jgi:hypothetical protein
VFDRSVDVHATGRIRDGQLERFRARSIGILPKEVSISDLSRRPLFGEADDRILRNALPAGAITPTGPPDVVLSGLPLSGDHPMHPFAIDAVGGLSM